MTRRYRIRTTREGVEVHFAEKARTDGAKSEVRRQIDIEKSYWHIDRGRTWAPLGLAGEAARKRLRDWRKDTGETLALNIGESVIRLEEV